MRGHNVAGLLWLDQQKEANKKTPNPNICQKAACAEHHRTHFPVKAHVTKQESRICSHPQKFQLLLMVEYKYLVRRACQIISHVFEQVCRQFEMETNEKRPRTSDTISSNIFVNLRSVHARRPLLKPPDMSIATRVHVRGSFLFEPFPKLLFSRHMPNGTPNVIELCGNVVGNET